MFYIKYFITCCIIICTVACTHNINLAPLLTGDSFILIETAIDNSIESSRNKAITLLSQNIFVTVKSNFSQQEVLKNDIYNTHSINEINSVSTGYFKDLVFSDTKYMAKDSYKTSVGLTKNSIINTINYLNNSMNISSVEILDKSSLENEYYKIQFLMALITFAESKNIKFQDINLQKLTTYRKKIELYLSNAAQLTFNILPNLNHLAKININNKDYTPNDTIFIAPGTYHYTVYAKDYKTFTKKIEVDAHDKIHIDLYLQKLLDKPVKVNLKIISDQPHLLNENVVAQIKSMLKKYQLTCSNYTNNILTIRFSTPTKSWVYKDHYLSTLFVNIVFSYGDMHDVRLNQTSKIIYSTKNTNIPPDLLLSNLDKFFAEVTSGDNLKKLLIGKS